MNYSTIRSPASSSRHRRPGVVHLDRSNQPDLTKFREVALDILKRLRLFHLIVRGNPDRQLFRCSLFFQQLPQALPYRIEGVNRVEIADSSRDWHDDRLSRDIPGDYRRVPDVSDVSRIFRHRLRARNHWESG